MAAANSRPRRPKEEHAKPAETQRRITVIQNMMTTGQWISGHSHNELAGKWNVSTSRVGQLAAEASRNLGELVGTNDDLLNQLRGMFQTIAKISISKADMTSALKAGEHLLKVALRDRSAEDQAKAERTMIEFLDPDGERV